MKQRKGGVGDPHNVRAILLFLHQRILLLYFHFCVMKTYRIFVIV